MPIGYFTLLISSLYLLETALIPGLLTQDHSTHISLLLLLTFIYQTWNNWIAGFLVFTLVLPFAFGEGQWWMFFMYIGLIAISYLLTQSILGTRSLSSYLVYTCIMTFTLSVLHVIIFNLPLHFFIMHWIFSELCMLFVRSAFPVRIRTNLSTL